MYSTFEDNFCDDFLDNQPTCAHCGFVYHGFSSHIEHAGLKVIKGRFYSQCPEVNKDFDVWIDQEGEICHAPKGHDEVMFKVPIQIKKSKCKHIKFT